MPRKFLKPSTWFGPDREKRTRAVVRALNLREYDALGEVLRDDFRFLDTAGSPVNGRDGFVAALKELHRIVPDLEVLVDDVSEQEGELLLKGRLHSPSDPDFRSESLWRAKIDNGRVSELQAFRKSNSLSTTRLTAHLRDNIR